MEVKFHELTEVKRRHRNEIIVLVGGCYDLLHVGHIAWLERCSEHSDILVVAISADNRISERKGDSRPVIPQHERVKMLAALACVDYALVAPDPIAELEAPTVRVIKRLQPDVFVTNDTRLSEYAGELAKMGTTARYLREIRLSSTTAIIERIKQHC